MSPSFRSAFDNDFWDKCQVFDFSDFEGLDDYMNEPWRRANIEKRHPETLKSLHVRFRGIVHEIILQHKLYHSANLIGNCCINSTIGAGGENPLSSTGAASSMVALYATPNVRLGRGKYATFLHSDATFSCNSPTAPVAMLNIWIMLNDTPQTNNHVMFYLGQKKETCHDKSRKMLYGNYDHMMITQEEQNDSKTLVYDDQMCWGSFYCFVAGQAGVTPCGRGHSRRKAQCSSSKICGNALPCLINHILVLFFIV
jgi:hypothetical protein